MLTTCITKVGSIMFIYGTKKILTSFVISHGSLGRQLSTASENPAWGISCSSNRTSFSVSLSPTFPSFLTKCPLKTRTKRNQKLLTKCPLNKNKKKSKASDKMPLKQKQKEINCFQTFKYADPPTLIWRSHFIVFYYFLSLERSMFHHLDTSNFSLSKETVGFINTGILAMDQRSKNKLRICPLY